MTTPRADQPIRRVSAPVARHVVRRCSLLDRLDVVTSTPVVLSVPRLVTKSLLVASWLDDLRCQMRCG